MNWHPAQDLGSLIIGLDTDADFSPYLSRLIYNLQLERGQLELSLSTKVLEYKVLKMQFQRSSQVPPKKLLWLPQTLTGSH